MVSAQPAATERQLSTGASRLAVPIHNPSTDFMDEALPGRRLIREQTC
jgi:hypothetical protein